MDDPRRPGVEPTFRHLDDGDVPWQAVKRQRQADGTIAEVREKWLAFSADPQYLSLYARYDPGMIVRRHGHFSPHVVFVIAGGLWCGGYDDRSAATSQARWCPAGTHIELPMGAAFGPFRAGPDGATLFEVMMGDPRSWGDRPDTYEAALNEHGVTVLDDPPLEFPPWLADLRSTWVGATPAIDTTDETKDDH